MKLLAFLFLLFFSSLAFSQNQGNIWYFGNGAGIDFNSGIPIALINGQTYNANGHSEGTAVICDSSGSLLFYTNGEKVWNKNHQIMPNGSGLLGHSSSTQSSLIVPLPGSDNIFYLFTTDSWYINSLVNGFRYSKIDMCLDNQLGDVIAGEKNILLLDTVSEKLTVVKHSNGIDYWVITHKYFSDKFYAYKLTSSGITDTVISAIGSIHEDNCPPPSPAPTRAAIGYMKASPNGAQLALVCVNTCDNLKELFDFNNASGIVSNFIDMELLTDTFGGYGVTFSPDNSKLYFTDTKNVFQYNLNAGGGNPDSIRNSKTQVSSFTSFTNDASLALQIGPDGKIYVARANKPFLAAINNPNQLGLACNFVDSVISLNGEMCSMGLPNLIDSYNYHNKMVQCNLGINDNNFGTQIIIYPNPSSGIFTLQSEQEITSIEIYNTLGENISPLSFRRGVGGEVEIDLSKEAKGIYFVKVQSGDKISTQKIIIE